MRFRALEEMETAAGLVRAFAGAAAAAFAFLPAPAAAQRYLVRTYTELDGIPNSFVSDLGQAEDGRMWLITRSGLVVYDGHAWERVDPGSAVRYLGFARLHFGPSSRPWLVTRVGCVLEPVGSVWGSAWRAHPELPSRRPLGPPSLAVFQTALASTPRGPEIAFISADSGLAVWRNGVWEFVEEAALEGRRPQAVAALGGRLFVGTDRGLGELSGAALDFALHERLALPGADIRGLASEGSGDGERLWILGSSWAGAASEDRFELCSDRIGPAMVPAGESLKLAPDRQGGLYFGSQAGVFHVAGDLPSPERIGMAQGLLTEGATALYVDGELDLWIAGHRGLSKLVSRRFANFTAREGLLEDEVCALLQRRSGEIVFGHNGGLTFLEGDSFRARNLQRGPRLQFDHGRIAGLAEDPEGNLYAAAWGFGLARIAPGGDVRWLEPEGEVVGTVMVDRAGTVWLGSQGGVSRLAGEVFEPSSQGELPATLVRRIAAGSDGTLYAATSTHGLYVRSAGRWRQAACGVGGPWDDLFAVHPARDGRVWVGSRAGLLVLASERLVRPDERALRIEIPVYALFEDALARLWIGTSDGIFRWDGRGLAHFGVRHGLAGADVNRAACLVDREGRVWIGTDRGVSLYQERFDSRPKEGPRVELSALEVHGVRLHPYEPHELRHGQNDLVVRAHARTLIDERRVRFRYELEGLETDWIETEGTPRFEARYPLLPPGRYRFHVQAMNAEERWGPIESSAAFRIGAPFWHSPTFLLLAVAAAAGLVATLQRLLDQRRYARRLTQEVRERTEELTASRLTLVHEKERLAAALASIADGVIAVDGACRVTLVNPAAERILGRSEESARGRPLEEVLSLSREDGSALDPRSLVRECALAAGSPLLILRSAACEGGEQSLRIAVSPLADGALPAGAVIAFRDATER